MNKRERLCFKQSQKMKRYDIQMLKFEKLQESKRKSKRSSPLNSSNNKSRKMQQLGKLLHVQLPNRNYGEPSQGLKRQLNRPISLTAINDTSLRKSNSLRVWAIRLVQRLECDVNRKWLYACRIRTK
jgi:hypothetical protein